MCWVPIPLPMLWSWLREVMRADARQQVGHLGFWCSHSSRMTERWQEQSRSIPWRSGREYNFVAPWRTGNCWFFSLPPFPYKVDATLSPGWAVLAGTALGTIILGPNSYELFDGWLSPPKVSQVGMKLCLHFCLSCCISLASGWPCASPSPFVLTMGMWEASTGTERLCPGSSRSPSNLQPIIVAWSWSLWLQALLNLLVEKTTALDQSTAKGGFTKVNSSWSRRAVRLLLSQ